MSISLASRHIWRADSSVCGLYVTKEGAVAEEITRSAALVLLHWTEGVCSRLGKVRRIKFYRDERGGLKGDAVVTFNSRATMVKAVERVKLVLVLVLLSVGA